MKTIKKTENKRKEQIVNDIIKYISIEGMNPTEAEYFYVDIEDAIHEHFNPEENE